MSYIVIYGDNLLMSFMSQQKTVTSDQSTTIYVKPIILETLVDIYINTVMQCHLLSYVTYLSVKLSNVFTLQNVQVCAYEIELVE